MMPHVSAQTDVSSVQNAASRDNLRDMGTLDVY